jgi:hypothetical protein
MAPDTRVHTFLKEAKGVWLEMSDNMGHFMVVIFTPPSRWY